MRTMFYAFAAIALACLLAGPVSAQTVCKPGQSLAEIVTLGETAVAEGKIEEFLILEGDSMLAYVKSLQGMGLPVPDGLSHMVIALRKDSTAIIFGFRDGCADGSAQLGPGMHKRARGVEA